VLSGIVEADLARHLGDVRASSASAGSRRGGWLGRPADRPAPPPSPARMVFQRDLYRRLESRARRGEKPGRPAPRPMTSLAALAGMRVAICCRRTQPISTPDTGFPTDASGSVATSKGHRRAWPAIGIGCRSSQGLQYWTDRPIQGSNCSYAARKPTCRTSSLK
jgi:hypothetical protein